MNKVILMGRLTRDPEIRYSQGNDQMAIAKFTLAVDRRFKRDNEQSADFISCTAFGRTADFFARYLHQGSKICLEGRIQTGSYTKQDGTKVYTTDVIVENVEFAESKAAASGGQQGYQPQQQMQSGYAGQSYQQPQQGYAGQPYQQAPQQQGYAGQSYQQPQQGYAGQPYQQASQPMQQDVPQMPYPEQPAEGQQAPMQEAADEGFMQIPDELENEGLPFN
ncbi:MAG: single-stranded DNA-binding protein [Parasporobacterium sp.]|nr:single-stranded DNA-binding protein [Parasporobacterium sp.]